MLDVVRPERAVLDAFFDAAAVGANG